MRNFKYVEFSRRTAKRNPNMIINEYNRLIREIDAKLSKSTTGLNINIPITTEFVIQCESLREHIHNSNICNQHQYKHELSFIEIIDLYKQTIKNFQSEINLLKVYEDIKKELEEFKLKFKTIKYY